jgi:hypothetical protein
MGRASIGAVMHGPRLMSPSRLPRARALVLLATLTGLFAMHGLGDHGVTHSAEHLVMGTTTPAAHVQVHAPAVVDEVSPFTATGSQLAGGREHDRLPAGMDLTGLCLAVLALAGLLAIAKHGASRWPGLARQLHQGQPAYRAHPRTADPPDRHRLQVHRC